MQNAELTAALEDVADLLALADANRFLIRAHRGAARTLEGLSRPVAAMIRAGKDPAALPGVGPRIAGRAQHAVLRSLQARAAQAGRLNVRSAGEAELQ